MNPPIGRNSTSKLVIYYPFFVTLVYSYSNHASLFLLLIIEYHLVLSCKFKLCGLHGRVVNNGFAFEKHQAGDYSIALSERGFSSGTFQLTALYEFMNPTPSSSFCAI